uniref:PPM-type phosphatase domain-containing protein n=1 Tax=Strongyloides venezuelensis TaxID=75913 RepID=A0A0K0G2Q9_STRVS
MDADIKNKSLKEQLKELLGNETDDNSPLRPNIRYRPPSYQTPKHDARSDAILIAIEQFQQKGISYENATLLGYDFIKKYEEELNLKDNVTFNKDIYEPLDNSMWCPTVIKYVKEYLLKVNSGEIDCPEEPSSWSEWQFSYCAQKNKRQKMEDKFVALPTLSLLNGDPKTAFFGVFDGHNGLEISTYCAAQFPKIIVDEKMENNVERLKKAFEVIDERINIRCIKESIRSGTTAVCAIVTKNDISLAWVGDSEGGVVKSDGIKRITRLHIPSDPDEHVRVEECGGIIISIAGELRVCGVLNLTRALGDIQGKPMISSEPDTLSINMNDDKTNYMLMLASDGVWGCLPDDTLNQVIRDFISSKPVSEYKKLATTIVEAAKDGGTTDNLTCIIVFLKPLDEVWKMFG